MKPEGLRGDVRGDGREANPAITREDQVGVLSSEEKGGDCPGATNCQGYGHLAAKCKDLDRTKSCRGVSKSGTGLWSTRARSKEDKPRIYSTA